MFSRGATAYTMGKFQTTFGSPPNALGPRRGKHGTPYSFGALA